MMVVNDVNQLNIDKSKLVLVKNKEGASEQYSLAKPLSYYKDAWLRFKRNKMSVIATIILSIILFFTIFGPYMKKYDLVETNRKFALKFQELPAKIPVVEKLGIFAGRKTLYNRNKAFIDSLNAYDDTIVVKIIREYDGKADIVVDYYKYIAYVLSFGDEDTPQARIETLTLEEYEEVLQKNAVLRLVEIQGSNYKVQIDYFRYALGTAPEDTYFWFGTDGIGADIFTNIWKASRVSLILATVITVINMIIGIILGSIMGYYGGTLDILFERFVDIIGNLPFMVILTLLILRYGSGFAIIIFAFVFNGWIRFYGTTRMQFYRYKNRDYVLAARSYGAGDARIIRKHIFPNAIGTLITSFSLAIPSFIFTESIYSFLGIIKYSKTTSIGRMLSEGQTVMQRSPHMLVFPAIYISILMITFNLISNGLRDAFNPTLRGVEE